MAKLRWNCPECGRGVLLGPAPRKNATARYCLPCSEKKGTLVERVSPVLERKREAARLRANERERKKLAKARAKFMVDGHDLVKELARIWTIARRLEPNLRLKPPLLTVNKREVTVDSEGRRWGHYTSGRAWRSQHRIHITAGVRASEVQEVLVHEVAHFLGFARGDQGHGDTFNAALTELTLDALKEDRKW